MAVAIALDLLAQRIQMPPAAVRAHVAQAQLVAMERLPLGDDGAHRHPRLVEQYGYRARAGARFSEANGGLQGAKIEHFEAVLTAVAAGRCLPCTARARSTAA